MKRMRKLKEVQRRRKIYTKNVWVEVEHHKQYLHGFILWWWCRSFYLSFSWSIRSFYLVFQISLLGWFYEKGAKHYFPLLRQHNGILKQVKMAHQIRLHIIKSEREVLTTFEWSRMEQQACVDIKGACYIQQYPKKNGVYTQSLRWEWNW